ncbi:glycerate kinase [Evansella sp. LMS18]|uniref:glycerate kinase n=1 Tax=Evansella sp. LMS18 TaxID=2924033 RepID=UPI0020D0DC3F|nr:glycerate kinase [Evansella sp. LMS18]UTR11954.1 glycerate kinase [Evansella sp. LMS18]
MNILVAPDSFKGSMTSAEAAEAIHSGIRNSPFTGAKVEMVPMADGGEGTVDALLAPLQAEKVTVKTVDPIGRKTEGFFAWNGDRKLAVIETAAASGITLLSGTELNPSVATTHGTGIIMKAALDKGAEEIVLGIGGSATADGGAGFLQALGCEFLDEKGQLIQRVSGRLEEIHRIHTGNLDGRVKKVKLVIASDVKNPLLGEKGAIAVFGPQKGVLKEEIPFYENGMKQFADLTVKATGKDYRDAPGAGAAGGFGFSLMSYLNGEMKNGFELIAELTSLEEKIEWADLVISGEGKLDEQTFYGKGPMGVARTALEKNKIVLLFGGSVSESFIKGTYHEENLIPVPLTHEIIPLQQAMSQGEKLLELACRQTLKTLYTGAYRLGGFIKGE